MSNAKASPSGIISGRSKTNLGKTKSKVGFLDVSDGGAEASSTSLRLRINEYSGQLGPKTPKAEMSFHAIADEDVRNPVTFKSQVDVKKTDFNLYETTQLLLGPTSNAPNYSYFTTRIERVYIFMLVLATSTASLVAILLYAHFILPPFLYAKDGVIEFFSSAKAYWIFHCSIPPIILFITIIYNVAVLQFHKAISWKKFAPIRWAVFLVVEIYLVTSTCYYLSQIHGIGGKIETAMAKDFNMKYMNHKNDPSISSVYRWVRGSRIEHVQVYYKCCGMNSWKDWKPVLKYWKSLKGKHYLHGDLCDSESEAYDEENPWALSEFKRNKKICKTPHTCWEKGKINITGMKKFPRKRITPVDFDTRKTIDPSLTYSGILGIHNDLSCLYAETVMAYTVIAVYIFILSCLIAFSSFVFWRTRKLIEVANKMKVDLYTRPQFEECL